MATRARPAVVALGALLALAASPGCKRRGGVVVGVEAQPAVVSQIGKIRVRSSVGAKLLEERTIVPKPAGDSLAAPESPFPFELKLDAAPGEEAEVTIEAYRAGPHGTIADTPMLVRRSRFPLGSPTESKLVRLQLETTCLTGAPGSKGPSCPLTQSCAHARCIDPTLLADDLEPYTATWATVRADVCRRANAGAPVVEAGTGQLDFSPLKDGEILKPERGPQGGHHLWVGVRMKNLRQAGTVVTLTGEQPGTGLKVPPTSFVFTFEPDQGGFCKLYGLRFQLDNSSVPVAAFLGRPLDVKIALRDTTGQTGEATMHLAVADETIGD